MDRRRRQFVPSSEGLDARLLLSTASAAAAQAALAKTSRIDRLANLLNSLEPNRSVPDTLIAPLQQDLRNVVGRLSAPNPSLLTAVNNQARSTISHASISVSDAAGLNATFGNALIGANAEPATVEKFQADMQNLLQADSQSTGTPAILAANDYTTMLQVALAVGKPIKTPTAPALQVSQSLGGKGGHTTTTTEPTLVGHYDAGTTINLLDENGAVIGTTTTPASGSYTIKVTAPLSVGTHVLRVQAFDVNGNHSLPSLGYKLVIKAATPRGPLK